MLESAKNRTRKYEIAWKDGTAVRDYARGINASGLRKILNERYFAHALADLPTVLPPEKKSLLLQHARAAEADSIKEFAGVESPHDVEDVSIFEDTDLEDFEDLES